MQTIKTRLKDKVDHHCKETRSNCGLFKFGKTKELTFFHVASYVINLEHLFFHNCQDILAATRRYSSDKKLSVFFLEKFHEEKGHDAWARMDWVNLSKTKIFTEPPVILKEMTELTDFLRKKMENSPYQYMAYMYAAEYMTTVLGPVWMDIMSEQLGIKRNQISALTNHIELDGDHAQEVAAVAESLKLSEDVQLEMLNFIDDLFLMYNKFFDALADIDGNKYYTDKKAS